MRKLFYIANIRFPTERAHGIQVAHMCSAFSRQGAAVTLLVPDRKTIDEDPYAYYGVERNFMIEKIPVPDVVRFGKAGFLAESLIFAWRAAGRVKKSLILNPLSLKNNLPAEDGSAPFIKGELREGAIIYTREELPLLFLPRGSAFYEAHQLRRSSFFKRLIRRARGVVAITQGLKNALVQIGISRERTLVAHDGYDEKSFAVRIDKNEARRRLSLPLDKKIAMYIGGLEPWKGAETLCKAASHLATDDILVAIIGGTEEEIEKMKPRYPAVRLLGARSYRQLPANQQAADILVVPNSGQYEVSRSFSSPLKLFAHMASGIVFCAARTPATEEVVTWEQAFPFTPDDPDDLTRVIARALSSESLSDRLARAASAEKRARDFTWDARASRIMAFLAT